jgi:hypothetical protein
MFPLFEIISSKSIWRNESFTFEKKKKKRKKEKKKKRKKEKKKKRKKEKKKKRKKEKKDKKRCRITKRRRFTISFDHWRQKNRGRLFIHVRPFYE